MHKNLTTKLLLPMIIVGILFLLGILFSSDNLSKYSVLAIVLVLVITQVVLSSFYFSKQITCRIAKLKCYLDLVVSTEQAPSNRLIDPLKDELGVVINELSQFIVSLGDVVSDIRRESKKLNQGSDELVTQMQNSVNTVDESVSQIEQMAQSIEEIANTSSTLSNNADQVSNTTSGVMTTLNQGISSSNTSQYTIESFAKEVESMVNDLGLLKEESARIGSVLDVIRGIADQTNLLALNAAIEAARAGDQGRGFAVVADEVRQLAQRTASSTNEIQAMVEAIQQSSEQVSTSLGDSVEAASKSVEQAQSTGEIIDEILQGIRLIRGQSQDISQHSKTQIDLSKSLSGQAEKLSALSQQTANLSEDSSKASEAVSEIASGLGEQLRAYGHSKR